MQQHSYALPSGFHAAMYDHYYQRLQQPDLSEQIIKMCSDLREYHLHAFINMPETDQQLEGVLLDVRRHH